MRGEHGGEKGERGKEGNVFSAPRIYISIISKGFNYSREEFPVSIKGSPSSPQSAGKTFPLFPGGVKKGLQRGNPRGPAK